MLIFGQTCSLSFAGPSLASSKPVAKATIIQSGYMKKSVSGPGDLVDAYWVPSVRLEFDSCRSFASNWRDIKVIGNYAYVGSEANDHGLQVR